MLPAPSSIGTRLFSFFSPRAYFACMFQRVQTYLFNLDDLRLTGCITKNTLSLISSITSVQGNLPVPHYKHCSRINTEVEVSEESLFACVEITPQDLLAKKFKCWKNTWFLTGTESKWEADLALGPKGFLVEELEVGVSGVESHANTPSKCLLTKDILP